MKTFAAVALILACYAGEARAQLGGGQSGMSTSTPVNNVKPFKELQSFGTCFARSQRTNALALIATAPGSAEEEKLFERLVYGERSTCMFGGTEMSLPIIFARGVIAEGLLRTQAMPETLKLASSPPVEVRDLHGAARCYTAGHRAEVEALLLTTPGSSEEVKAAAGLWTDLKACMPGMRVRLNAPWIRFLLAEALLRLGPVKTASGG